MSNTELPDRIINEVYILIAEDEKGLEGITMSFPPFLTSNKEQAVKMFEKLKHNPLPKGTKLKLCKFSNKETILIHSIANTNENQNPKQI